MGNKPNPIQIFAYGGHVSSQGGTQGGEQGGENLRVICDKINRVLLHIWVTQQKKGMY